MHPFRVLSITVQNLPFPAQLRPNLLGSPGRSVANTLALAPVYEPVAMPAREDRSSVEDRDSPAASRRWANEPRPLPAEE